MEWPRRPTVGEQRSEPPPVTPIELLLVFGRRFGIEIK